jgi:hypothetical protein
MDDHLKYKKRLFDAKKEALLANTRRAYVLAPLGEAYNANSDNIQRYNNSLPDMRYAKSKMLQVDSSKFALLPFSSDSTRALNDAFICKATLQGSSSFSYCRNCQRVLAVQKRTNWEPRDYLNNGHVGRQHNVEPITQESLLTNFAQYRRLSENLSKLRNTLDSHMNTVDVGNLVAESNRNILKIRESKRRKLECDD